MGDRANIFFVDSELSDTEWGGMYFYSHWGGSAMPEIAQVGLQNGRGRWGDSQYLARILFCALVRDDIDGETGYGLSTIVGDNERVIIRVNDLDYTVAYCEPGTEFDRTSEPLHSWTYEEFLAADPYEHWS